MEKLSFASTILLIAGALVATLGNIDVGRAPAYVPSISGDTGDDGAEFEAGQCDNAAINGSGALDFNDAETERSDIKGHVQDDSGRFGGFDLAVNGTLRIAGHPPHPSGEVAYAHPVRHVGSFVTDYWLD